MGKGVMCEVLKAGGRWPWMATIKPCGCKCRQGQRAGEGRDRGGQRLRLAPTTRLQLVMAPSGISLLSQ